MNKWRKATPEDIEKVRKILKRRNAGLILMLLYVPIVSFIHQLTESEILFFVTALLIMFSVMAILLPQAFVRCPRCKIFFYTKWYYTNGFTHKCVHCGLSSRG